MLLLTVFDIVHYYARSNGVRMFYDHDIRLLLPNSLTYALPGCCITNITDLDFNCSAKSTIDFLKSESFSLFR